MKLIFDIGYNVGDFTSVCLDKSPDCKVVGIDANPTLCHYNKHSENKNVKVINALVSSVDNDKKDFYVDPINIGISTASETFIENSRFSKGSKYLGENTGNWINIGKVRTVTLDTLINFYGEPDLIKVDVEGYEYEVFSGLSKKVGKLCFECHEEEKDNLYKILDHLSNLGYDQFGLIGIFEQGDVFEKLTYSEHGDPHLVEPENYYSWQELKEEIEKCFIEDRRINYGMLWVK
jgi:FkbM family methyltransferase